MKRRTFLKAGATAFVLPRLALAQGTITEAEARAIAREAYVYAFPMVENYLSIYKYALDPDDPDYKGPPNAVHNVARVFTPEDRGVVSPNSDTPYSFLIMDLRAEPLVVTLPAIEADRYYSVQLVDLYTHNVDYLGTRKDGNDGGDFLIAGPDWDGEVPPDVSRVVRMPTRIAFGLFRTQLFDAADLDRVKEIQAGYGARPLSAHAGTEAPPPAPEVDWPAIGRDTLQANFWSYANFLFQFAPPLPWEEELRARFAEIGVAPARDWPAGELPGPLRIAVTEAAADAYNAVTEASVVSTSSAGYFGSPEEMRGRYMERAVAAMVGLYGNSPEEALYPIYFFDADGEPLDTSRNDYVLRFPPDGLPPVRAFWSITMYDGNTRFLVDNPLDRYLINSSMLPDLKRNAAGEIVIYIQHESPGPALESNWLPAPDGPLFAVMRLYLPEAPALDGRWQAPQIEVARGSE